VNPEFIKRYYETSRLHYLSTWKGELKEIVEKLEQKYPKSSSSKRSTRRIVMHIDFDCFFASVGIKDRSWLKNKPVAVSHSKGASEASSSDIGKENRACCILIVLTSALASCNYVARSYGLRNGMT
jgi:DNA repair protein REV1